MKKKLELLKSIPKIVFAPTAGILQAKSSSFFKENTKFIREFRGLNMPHKYEESESRKFFGINDKEFVIMFGAMYIDEERKGVRYLIESLHMVSKQINRKIIALIPGNINQEFESIDNIDFKYIGLLSYEDLYKAFAASNVYISPSIADSGPMMVRYSIACGTPVVAFPIGYSLDYIKHKETGYLAKLQNSKELSDGILYFYNNRDRQDEFRKNCLKLNNEALSNKRAIDLLFP